MEFNRIKDKFFDDLVYYLITLYSIHITSSFFKGGNIEIYRGNPKSRLYSIIKQKLLIFDLDKILNPIYNNEFPTSISYKEKDSNLIYSEESVNLYEMTLDNSYQSMFINYYERNKLNIIEQHGEYAENWSSVWDFGRVIRNSFGHGNKIYLKAATPDRLHGIT